MTPRSSRWRKLPAIPFAELVRHQLFDNPPPRALHRCIADDQAIARVLAEVARLKAEAGEHGSNLNQIANHLNAGRPAHGTRLNSGLSCFRPLVWSCITTIPTREIGVATMLAREIEERR